jgi:hypothetical protein
MPYIMTMMVDVKGSREETRVTCDDCVTHTSVMQQEAAVAEVFSLIFQP